MVLIIKIIIMVGTSMLSINELIYKLIRNWKKSNKIDKTVRIAWVVFGISASIIIGYDLIESSKLQHSHEVLTKKVQNFEKDNKKKDKEIEKLKRGITTSYFFNGKKRVTEGPNIKIRTGQHYIYQKLKDLESKKEFNSIIALCKQQIEKIPKWVTPYYYLGVTYANTGHLIKAINSFEYFINNAPDTKTYDSPKEKAQQIIEIVKSKLK